MAKDVPITQELVDAIIARAKKSTYGLDPSEKKSNNIDMYEPKNLSSLALLLVSGWTAKYDLVSIFSAAFEELKERSQ